MRAHLTARNVTTLPAPSAGQIEYFDDSPGGLPGFALRVSARGRRSYSLLCRTKSGRQVRLTLGDAARISLANARDLARQALRDLALGHDPTAQREAPDVGGLARMYIETHRARLRPRTLTGYEQITRRLPKAIASTRAADLKRADLRVFLEKVADSAPVMANRITTFLKAVFRWATGEQLVEANPIEGLRRPRSEKPRDRVLSDAEIAALWGALDASKPAVAAAVRLLLLLGQRLGETLLMEWNELDLQASPPTWTIPPAKRKTGDSGGALVVPLPPAALRILRELHERNGQRPRVLHGVSYASRSFWFNAVREAAIRLGVAPFKLHDLRRTLRTGLSRLRVPFEVREAVIGHSTTGLVRVYDRYDLLPEKASALAAWAAHVEAVVSGETRRARVLPIAQS